MKISILTLFPEMFTSPFAHSILKRAQEKNLLELQCINIRDFGIGAHKLVDDTPYGGGAGMVMRYDVLEKAITAAKCTEKKCKEKTVLLDPQGIPYKQTKAKELAQYDHLILVCGHYEGVDERVRDIVDEELSIGDYVLTGGEIPALVVVDSVARLIPEVLGKNKSSQFETFEEVEVTPRVKNKLLEYPQYTRPAEHNGKKVPEILLSGNHQEIEKWRKEKALRKTAKQRPDLIQKGSQRR